MTFFLKNILKSKVKGLVSNSSNYTKDVVVFFDGLYKYRAENKKDSKYLNRMYQKKHKYGLSEDEYLFLFEKQNNRCAICDVEFDYNIYSKNPCVDHSHNNGEVRGLLCDKCNRGIGAFDDNIDILKNAIIYLKKYS